MFFYFFSHNQVCLLFQISDGKLSRLDLGLATATAEIIIRHTHEAKR